jgi:nitroreductase
MDLFAAVETRASVRAFHRHKITDEMLRKILDAGRRAPSGYNLQPREFIIVRDREILNKLGRIQSCISQAEAAIAVVVDEKSTKYWREDAAAAIENMLLAIVALGFVSLWVEGYVLMNEEYGKDVLGVPRNLRLLAILPIGKPVSKPTQGRKKPLEEIAHLNRYGTMWQPNTSG